MPKNTSKKIMENILGGANDAVTNYRKANKKTKSVISVIWLTLTIIVTGVTAFVIHDSVKNTSERVAVIAGTVSGVLDSVSDLPAAYSNGKNEGLSAEDTEAYLSNEFQSTGKLEVLVAGIKITNLHEYADKYKGLYMSKGYAVFTIDLSLANIKVNSNEINITLNAPTVECYIDEMSTKKIAEWQQHAWTGTTQDGYVAYLNSWNVSKEVLEKSIEGYSSLVENSKQAGINQITQLIKAACGSKKTINIKYSG